MQIEIKKPIYSDYIYIRKETLELAARLGELLEVKIPQGSRAIDPKEWMAKGKIMKKIFKQPGNPMILFGNHLMEIKPLSETHQITPQIDLKQASLL